MLTDWDGASIPLDSQLTLIPGAGVYALDTKTRPTASTRKIC